MKKIHLEWRPQAYKDSPYNMRLFPDDLSLSQVDNQS